MSMLHDDSFEEFAGGSDDMGMESDLAIFALMSAARLECLKLAIADRLIDHAKTMDRAMDYAEFVTGIGFEQPQ